MTGCAGFFSHGRFTRSVLVPYGCINIHINMRPMVTPILHFACRDRPKAVTDTFLGL